MFEELFEGPIARARQRESPLPDERRRFLSHLQTLGYAHSSLRAIACELIVIAARLDLSGSEPFDAARVTAAARGWATYQVRRHHGTDPALSTRNFRYWAEQWLRYLGRWHAAPPVAAPPFRSLLDGFTTWMADERGLAPGSIRSHSWKAATFLTWYERLERPFADVTIQDVDDFLAAKGHATWSRRSVAIAAQALRAFFRYAECHQQCREDIAAMIAGPRLFDQDTLPSGPPWAIVTSIITRHDTDVPADVRRRAALLLFATYGLRVGEVARLTLDDLDWEHGTHSGASVQAPRRPALPADEGSRRGALTLHHRRPPAWPVAPGVSHGAQPPPTDLLRRALERRESRVPGQRCPDSASRSTLRHACATRLLSEGWSLKEIGDHLGHRSAEATTIYAKVDLPRLREVARFDVGGLR